MLLIYLGGSFHVFRLPWKHPYSKREQTPSWGPWRHCLKLSALNTDVFEVYCFILRIQVTFAFESIAWLCQFQYKNNTIILPAKLYNSPSKNSVVFLELPSCSSSHMDPSLRSVAFT